MRREFSDCFLANRGKMGHQTAYLNQDK